MKNRAKKHRIYSHYQGAFASLNRLGKNRDRLQTLLNQMPRSPITNPEVWSDMVPVGREFGSKDYNKFL